eukprot:1259321-Amphidinium_carterae.1
MPRRMHERWAHVVANVTKPISRRRIKKEAKRLGIKKAKRKDPGIPNSWPFKVISVESQGWIEAHAAANTACEGSNA